MADLRMQQAQANALRSPSTANAGVSQRSFGAEPTASRSGPPPVLPGPAGSSDPAQAAMQARMQANMASANQAMQGQPPPMLPGTLGAPDPAMQANMAMQQRMMQAQQMQAPPDTSLRQDLMGALPPPPAAQPAIPQAQGLPQMQQRANVMRRWGRG
jgi:hypothetical protein